MNLQQLRKTRAHAQGLYREHTDIAAMVHAVAGLQSQELPSATLGVRARTTATTAVDVRHAREVERSVVMTWAMRGTLHLVAAEDLPWMLRIFGPEMIRKTERRYKQLNLDADTRERAANLMRHILDAPLTRPELAEALAKHGVPVAGQAIHHLVRYAALAGVICLGPERDGDLTYVPLDEWLGESAPVPDDLAAHLVRRYLAAYGPATPHDLASWAGVSVSLAKAGFKALDLVEVETPLGALWTLTQPQDHPGLVRLLPRYDGYNLGYKDRGFMVTDDHAKKVHPGGGIIHPVVLVDGAARGVWRREKGEIVVEPFDDRVDAAADVADIQRFLGD